MRGVSIVIPAYNAEGTIEECARSALAQEWPGDLEVIVVNDGSTDGTREVLARIPGLQLVDVPNGGAARATNIGITRCNHDIVVSLDADAVLEPGWMRKIVPCFDEPRAGAVAGYPVTGNSSIVGKLMGYDVELRFDKSPRLTDHLYTMNTAYLKSALLEVGLLDEHMKIGYDADLSRRLKAAGWQLVLCKDARCRHYWRDDLRGYIKQQYNYAYYRLSIARKSGRARDRLVGVGMLAQVPLTVGLVLAAALGCLISPFALLLLLLIPMMHLPETVELWFKKKDPRVLLLPWLFTLRNFTWVWAAVVWGLRRVVFGVSLMVRRARA